MALRAGSFVFLLAALLRAGDGDVLKLPPPPAGGGSVAEALKARRSVRVFDPEGPDLAVGEEALLLLPVGRPRG